MSYVNQVQAQFEDQQFLQWCKDNEKRPDKAARAEFERWLNEED